MAKKMTVGSLNVVRDRIRFPLHVVKTRLKEKNPVLFEELKKEFNLMDETLHEIVNNWDIWDE